jgi:NADH:ubiquinone oxidoreductase subunit
MPSADEPPAKQWQREHLPNLTGTHEAYRPPGHTLEGGRRSSATGDYEPWSPN